MMTIARQLQSRPMQVLSVLLLANAVTIGVTMVQAADAGVKVPLLGTLALLTTLASLIGLARLVRDPLERLETAIRGLNAEIARGGEQAPGLGLPLSASGDLSASTRSLLRARQVLAERHRKAEVENTRRRDMEEVLEMEFRKRDVEIHVRHTAAAELAEALRRLANGELGLSLDLAMPAELEAVRIHFNRTSAILAQSIGLGEEGHAATVRDAGIVLSGSSDLAAHCASQASGIVELRRSTRNLGAKAKARASEAQELSLLSTRALTDLKQSVQVIAAARSALDVLAKTAGETDTTIRTAQQTLRDTSLASLNAGIAAVQSGEAGVALATVLKDVRMLAEHSAHAAGSLSGIKNHSGTSLSAALSAIDRASREIEAIGLSIETIEERVSALAQADAEDAELMVQAETIARDLESGAREQSGRMEKTVATMNALFRSLGRIAPQLPVTYPSLSPSFAPQTGMGRPANGRPYLRRVK